MTSSRDGASPIDATRRSREVIPLPSERSFGVVFTVVFAAIAGYQMWGGLVELGAVTATLAGATACVAWLRPSLLRGPNRLWFRFGLLLNRIVTPLVMFVVFAVTIVPIGLVLRVVRYDPLRRGRDPAAPSYWIDRSPPGPEPDSMRNQF